MVIPVSATSYKQKKISSYNIYNSIYYGKYSHDYKFGSDYLDTYDVDINNDGYPEHIEYFFEDAAYKSGCESGNLTIVYTSYKNKVRRYVFRDSFVRRYKKYLVINTCKNSNNGDISTAYIKYYSIKNGKLVENKKIRHVYKFVYNSNNDTYQEFHYKAGKRISEKSYLKNYYKQREIKSSPYWKRLFNSFRNYV